MKASSSVKAPDQKLRTVSRDVQGEDKETEDPRMSVASQFYMGASNTSPHSLGPSISSEGFLLFKKLFRRRPKQK